MDENVTEDESDYIQHYMRTSSDIFHSFYGGPLRGIFNNLRRRNILRDVHTLILDGLAVPADLVSEIILNDSFNVRVLSIREVQHLNERRLQQALMYAIRPSRPENTPKLQCLYIFGPKDPTPVARSRTHTNHYPAGIAPIDTLPSYGGVISSQGAQIGAQWNQKSEEALADDWARDGDKWFYKSGKVLSKQPSSEWATTIMACRGIISFDAVLCGGPRHSTSSVADRLGYGFEHSSPWHRHPEHRISPRVATHALGGCHGCGVASEGFAVFGQSPLDRFPLLAPLSIHSSTEKAAKSPINFGLNSSKRLIARCSDCLKNRYCESCHKWWCEDCYEVTMDTLPASTEWDAVVTTLGSLDESEKENVKVHMGLCAEECLVAEMMSGAGSNGMWG